MEFVLLAAAVFLIWYMLVFLLMIHEYGHLLAMKALNIKADKIVIGNVCLFRREIDGVSHEIGLIPGWAYVSSKDYENASHGKRAIVAAAGPLMSLVTGAMFYAIHQFVPMWPVSLAATGSFVLVVTNIIPLPPLDGWPIMEAALFRAGIVVSEKARKKLLAVGIASIVLVALLI